jgi:hypothetical protein
MHYKVLIIEDELNKYHTESPLGILEKAGRLIRYDSGSMTDRQLIEKIDKVITPDIRVSPASSDLRLRHVVKHGLDWYILFNEGASDINCKLDLSADGDRFMLDPADGEHRRIARDAPVSLAPHAIRIIAVKG